jgi:hypothetical protein
LSLCKSFAPFPEVFFPAGLAGFPLKAIGAVPIAAVEVDADAEGIFEGDLSVQHSV